MNTNTIQRLLAAFEDVSPDMVDLESLAGDASDRKFFRARLPGGRTRIVMELAPPLPAPEDPDQLPYINILNHLRICRVPVPRLHHYDPAAGLLILEDLGDTTLEECVRSRGIIPSLPLYRKAVEELLTLQLVGTQKRCEHCMAFRYSFDVEKLMWELNFFLEHTVQGYFGRSLKTADGARIRHHFERLCRFIAEQPRFFTHRDYHSRNLMVHKGNIGIIDFQDARLGPLQYDLCSLLRDAYVRLPEEVVDELIVLYLDGKDRIEGTRSDRADFRKIFDWVSIQRNLKAAGTFGYMATVKGKERYLRYLPDTFGYVRENLAKYPELQDLRSALGTCLPEVG